MNDKQKTKIKKILSWSLTVIVLGLMAWYLINNKNVFDNLRLLNPLDIIIIACLQPVNIVISALINKLIIESIDQEMPYTDALLLQFANNFLNRFISEGGAVYRGAYLKTQYAFPISKFLASIGGVYIVSLLTNAALGLTLSLIIYLTDGVFNVTMLVLFLGLLIGTIILLAVEPTLNSKWKLIRKINQVIVGWNQIKSNQSLILKLIGLSGAALLNTSIIVFIAYQGLNTDIKLINAFFYSTISSLSNVINLTPGGLGINEAILMFSSEVIGVSREVLLLGSLMLRAISVVTTFSFGGVSYLILNFRLQKSPKVDSEMGSHQENSEIKVKDVQKEN